MDIAGPLGVSHFLILTATENAAYLRLAKTPRVCFVASRKRECTLVSRAWRPAWRGLVDVSVLQKRQLTQSYCAI